MIATRGEAGRGGGCHGRAGRTRLTWLAGLVVLIALATVAPLPAEAHPLGNFSISHYAGIRVEPSVIELRYLIDMAEIPTFQEVQETGISPESGHPSLKAYLERKMEALNEGLLLELNGRRLQLRGESTDVIFPPGAGGLPTMKLGILYRAKLDAAPPRGLQELRYRDANFPDRAGWKEIVAVEGAGIAFVSSSVPEKDRSNQLADYPTDLLNSPPQQLEARVLFGREKSSRWLAAVGSPGSPSPRVSPDDGQGRSVPTATQKPERSSTALSIPVEATVSSKKVIPLEPIRLQANSQGTPRNAFTELLGTNHLRFGVVLFALAVAAGLGAFHGLEPGHGKTVVGAYLVGSRGTAWHAMLLGLIVTASHTAGVYLLGAVTLYASRYVVPERLYPWLGVVSGLIIAGLGCSLFLRRYRGETHFHSPEDHSHRGRRHHHDDERRHSHGAGGEPGRDHGAHQHRHPELAETVSLRELLAVGVSGGIVPCPAALVVLLSAISLRRVGFGLLLILAFSVGLAAVLIAIGLLMVYARRFMSRFQRDGRLVSHWLPLTSSAVITLFGLAIALQALATAGILQIRL